MVNTAAMVGRSNEYAGVAPAYSEASVPPITTEKLSLLLPRFDSIPEMLTSRPQWVVWIGVWQPEKGKYSKVPYCAFDPSRKASSTDPETWSDFATAKRCYENNKGRFAGVGFVLTDDDPFCGIDLDHAIEGREITPAAAQIVLALNSYAEVSPSGTGLRIFIIACLPPGGRKKGDTEMYSSGRFLTVTGRQWSGTPPTVEERQAEVEALHARVFPSPVQTLSKRTREAGVGFGDASDTDLLSRVFQAANGAKIGALYGGDTSAYSGHSEADLALCSALAFWTGPDPIRLDRLFRSSALMRDKWDERHYADGSTYGEKTIQVALSGCTEFYTPKADSRDSVSAGMRDPTAAGDAGALPGTESVPTIPWPEQLRDAAFHGIAGEIVRAIEPHTESDIAALLLQLLPAFGNLIGRHAYYPIEADRHYCNIFVAMVGQSAKGRKGTSWGHIKRLMDRVECGGSPAASSQESPRARG